MSASKNLFMLMQEQSITTENFLPNKKELQFNAKQFVSKMLDTGETDKTEIFCQAVRLNEVLNVITDELKKSLPQENFEAFGIKGTYRNGGDTLNYKEDPIYADIERELKERAELIKTATNSTNPIYDSEGIEVTKVSKTSRKSSLSISF